MKKNIFRYLIISIAAGALLSCSSSIPKVKTIAGARGSIVEQDEVMMLDSVGGVLRTSLEGIEGDVIITKKDERIIAVMPRCTYDGCETDLSEKEYSCPCCGSHFALTGKRLSGQAEEDLPTFNVERMGPRKIRILR